MRPGAVLWLSVAVMLSAWPESISASASELLPFVGCPGEDMAGPKDASSGNPVTTPLDAKTARGLSFYAYAGNSHFLAPRGWHCYSTSGTSTINLVTPDQKGPAPARDHGREAVKGPAVLFFSSDASGSREMLYARYAARFFPTLAQDFVHNEIAYEAKEFGGPKSKYVFPKFPSDRIVYKSKFMLEYMTPAGRDGLGTSSDYLRFSRSELPIYGVLALVGDESKDSAIIFVAIRLPPKMNYLRSAIIQDAERTISDRMKSF